MISAYRYWDSENLKAAEATSGLLSADDPAPVEWVNRYSPASVLLLCEHAGSAVPVGHNQMGLTQEQLQSHIGWDIGAAAVARKLASLLRAPLILQRYSRLMIDCNRPPGSADSIPTCSDGIEIPANLNLDHDEQLARQDEIFKPLDLAICEGLTNHQRTAVFSVHSFTPQLRGQKQRRWNAGFLTRRDQNTGNALVKYIEQQKPHLTLAVNEPYFIEDETDWFIPQYAEPRGLMHCLIEIRNDQLRDDESIETWAMLMAGAIKSVTTEELS